MFSNADAYSSFSTNDIEKAQHFYGEILGLPVVRNEMGILEIKFHNGGHAIIYPKPDHVPATFTVLNFPVLNIDDAVDELTAKGVQFEHIDSDYIKTDEKGIARGTGKNTASQIAWFKDPAGNFIAILQID